MSEACTCASAPQALSTHLACSNGIASGNGVSHDIHLEARAERLCQRLQRKHADLR